ncbi:hypothetical protein KIN20_017785 [Parelaphostrongylus tenuis]|uniref:Uncharacterized protein n=1 Tax=Parelaphostrongylus tenuis TaxID=148309 RepID=A0AAD5N3H9_PARTN|nr:hypothetical protein KIN20_017785 [Parelaphostrongylus tenuis]
MDMQPYCIIVGNVVIALCTKEGRDMCIIDINMNIGATDSKHRSISGSFTSCTLFLPTETLVITTFCGIIFRITESAIEADLENSFRNELAENYLSSTMCEVFRTLHRIVPNFIKRKRLHAICGVPEVSHRILDIKMKVIRACLRSKQENLYAMLKKCAAKEGFASPSG